uniref:Uncharacterized protein n=1 Tax=Rousettus aegyptiacus TaxID=9407 RepID=A0A7J8E946_ROUAE|nr:hypothetical protein HJG63_008185 [Rousettus aegyptiacus]
MPSLLSRTFSDKPIRYPRRLTHHTERGSTVVCDTVKGRKFLASPIRSLLTSGADSCTWVPSQRLDRQNVSLWLSAYPAMILSVRLKHHLKGVKLMWTLQGVILMFIGPCKWGLSGAVLGDVSVVLYISVTPSGHSYH